VKAAELLRFGFALVVGWTVTVLIADSLPIRNKVWEAYDLFWLVLVGLIAAAFFIADSQMAQHDADFRETGNDAQRASGYLLKQVEAYISWCRQNAPDHAVYCSWASHVHPKLLDTEFEYPILFVKLGPDSSAACMEIRVAPRHQQKWTRSAEKSQPTIKDFVRWRI
jgi:hypothetical protein